MKDPEVLEALIHLALEEDIGQGDWTTFWTVPAGKQVEATIVARAAGVIAGTSVARAVFNRVDPDLDVQMRVADGSHVQVGEEIARVHGSARSILSAERVVLNFLQHLSGIATTTRRFVQAVEGTGARILDTRKTLPGLRALQKDAVKAGGAVNHRFGLYDAILIKENHIRSAGGIEAAVRAVGARNSGGLFVEVEVTNLEEVREALAAGVDRILLDNMTLEMMGQAVEIVRAESAPPETEASGGVSLETVRSIASTGVDYISVGALTHSAPALDLSLLVQIDSDD